jgi:hypothetical protein
MKRYSYILLLCYAISSAACHARMVPQGSTFNKEIKDEGGKPQLLGKCTRGRLEQAPYDSWFVKNYTDYRVDSVTAGQIRAKLVELPDTGTISGNTHPDKHIRLKIFMGTWCGDSQREVPRIFKILDYCGVDSSMVQLIMVSDADSTYKQSPGHEEKGLNIFRVPDLIVLDKGKELGRIVESPVQSLEKDLLALLDGESYIPHYRGVALLVDVFRTEKRSKIEHGLAELAARVKPLVRSPSELKSYAHVLRAAGEGEKAAIALQINELIFPGGK